MCLFLKTVSEEKEERSDEMVSPAVFFLLFCGKFCFLPLLFFLPFFLFFQNLSEKISPPFLGEEEKHVEGER